MKFRLSDESTNTYGYKVRTSGIIYSTKVPALLWHNLNSLPIGYFTDFQREEGELYASLVIDESEYLIKNKIEKGFLTDVSIGFIVDEIQNIQGIDVVTKCRLLEVSLVAVGANRNAKKIDVSTNNAQKKLAVGEIMHLKVSNNQYTIMEEEKEKLIETIKELQEKVLSLNAQIAEKDAEIVALKAEGLKRDAEKLVDLSVLSGKILPNQKETYIKLAIADFESTKSLIESLSSYTSINDLISKGKNNERDGWTFKDWQKKDPKGLALMRENDSNKYKELLQTLNK